MSVRETEQKIGICGGEQNGHKVQKSQISYYNRHLYACVSFLKVKKKAELPEDYFVLTLGLSAPLESDRVAANTVPGSVDNAFCHQQSVRFGRGAV